MAIETTNELCQDTKRWHYTTVELLRQVLSDGLIKTADEQICRGEKPAVWFSSHQVWEPTATKGCQTESGRRDCTIQEMIDLGGGLARIGISPAYPGLMNWYQFKRSSGIPSKGVKGLEPG